MSEFLNESNIEVTEVTIPENETLENINEFLKTMGQKLKDTNLEPAKVIQGLNVRGIIIKGTRNESYAIAEQLHWKLHRRNPSKKVSVINMIDNPKS